MDWKPHSKEDAQAQQIAELEAELARAYEAIDQLQKQNAELQTQLNQQDTNWRQNAGSVRSINRGNSSEFLDVKIRPKRWNIAILISTKVRLFWSKVQFAAIATAVAGTFIFVGLKLTQKQVHFSTKASIDSSPFPSAQKQKELVYNVKDFPNLQKSKQLQVIVNELVKLAQSKGMNVESLSISLIDLNSGEFAEYQQVKLRFPASVVKLFWMVFLYAKINNGMLQNDPNLFVDLLASIKKSDNEAASRILDKITNTQSGTALSEPEFTTWLNQRQQINRFFEAAGYNGINLSQKTFPIPYLKLPEPQGRDLQMRGDPEHPIRNQISTQQASRLMYEIFTGQAVSQEASQNMMNLLAIAPATRIKNRTPQDPNVFNPVHGFLSQSLPNDVYFAAKAGWTSSSRQETAYIATPDGKTVYILTIFAEDRAYAFDWNIFPKMSRLVFDRMTLRS